VSIIFHLIPQSEHRAHPADCPYTPATFAAEGFIHCTGDISTLEKVANAFFTDLPEPLLCYSVDTDRLTAPVRREPPAPVAGAEETPHPAETLFPHIYGTIDRAAIVDISPLHRDTSGRWQLNQNKNLAHR